MEVKMIDMKDIVTNPLQPRQTFDREKLQELADSIKEGELLQPIVVRSKGKKFEIVCGERRYNAFQILKEPKIPAIVRVIKDDTDALEKSLIENWQRDDLTSAEKERALKSLWDSKRYKDEDELGKKLGLKGNSILHMLHATRERERLKISETISTRTIEDTGGLKDEPKKKLLEQVEKGKISTDNVRDVVRKVKEFKEPEQQMAILEEFEEQEEQSKEVFNGIIEKQRQIAKGNTEPERFIEQDASDIRIDAINACYASLSSITSSYVKKIEPESKKKKAIDVLKKMRTHIDKVLISLGETEVIQVGK